MLGQFHVLRRPWKALGLMLYRHRDAVPDRQAAARRLVGGPLLIASATATLFGLYEQVSVWGSIATLPVAAWEATLGVWLIVKGFKPSPILREGSAAAGRYAEP
jgi:hypothetical protein